MVFLDRTTCQGLKEHQALSEIIQALQKTFAEDDNMSKYELSDAILSNLMVFLDRTTYKGLRDHQALSEILHALHSPIEKNNEEVE